MIVIRAGDLHAALLWLNIMLRAVLDSVDMCCHGASPRFLYDPGCMYLLQALLRVFMLLPCFGSSVFEAWTLLVVCRSHVVRVDDMEHLTCTKEK